MLEIEKSWAILQPLESFPRCGRLWSRIDFMHQLMSDHLVISDVDCRRWANVICPLISQSDGQKVYFLGWRDDDSEVSDDDSITLMMNL